MLLRLGKSNVKAQPKLWKKTNYHKQDILKLALKFKKKSGEFSKWIKLDIIMSKELNFILNNLYIKSKLKSIFLGRY